MEIKPGPHRHTTDELGDLMLDRRLSRSQLDVVTWAIAEARKLPADVTSVVLEEGGVVVEYIARSVDGRPQLNILGDGLDVRWVLVGPVR